MAPGILGVDFLLKYNLVLDFTSTPVSINPKTVNEWEALSKSMKPLIDAFKKTRICAVEAYDEPAGEAIDSCAIPLFGKATLVPGHTELAEHFIPTTGTPVKIPPHKILANCRVDVEEQIQTMLKEGIIEERSSPWIPPAVFVRKKNGDV